MRYPPLSSRLRVVPHFSSGIVERAKRERAWKSPHAFLFLFVCLFLEPRQKDLYGKMHFSICVSSTRLYSFADCLVVMEERKIKPTWNENEEPFAFEYIGTSVQETPSGPRNVSPVPWMEVGLGFVDNIIKENIFIRAQKGVCSRRPRNLQQSLFHAAR